MLPTPSKICGIILAAGRSKRMGTPKQLLYAGGRPILEHVILNADRSRLHEVIVVLGYMADKIKTAINFSDTDAIIVINKNHDQGQSSSLLKGFEHISHSCDAAMFLLGDQPLVTHEIINTLILAYEKYHAPVTIPYYRGKRGNPVIIGKELFNRLKTLSGDRGARFFFRTLKDQIMKIPFDDEAVIMDIDTKKDYENIISKF